AIGGLAWVGCNRHGLALVNNDLMLRSVADGIPSQAGRRIVLAQPDVRHARDALAGLPHMSGRAYLIGGRAGRTAAIEVSALGARTLDTERPLVHTNHALIPEIARDEDEAALAATYPSSRHRLAVLRRIAAGAASVEAVADVLRNQEGAPDAI